MWNPYNKLEPGTRRLRGAAAIGVVLLAWFLISTFGLAPPSKLPSPQSVVRAFGILGWDADKGESLLATATLWSSLRVFCAGVLVVIVGVPIGILMGASPKVNAVLSPLVDPFRSAPVVALLPIIVIWLGIGEESKIAFLFLGAVVFLVPMVRDAMLAVSQQYWVSARDLGGTPFEAVWHGVVPMAKPRIADAVIVAVSVMWTYITVAEYVNAQRGLGQLIQSALRRSAMDQVFAGIFVIIALALVSYGIMVALKRKLYPWESE